MDGGGRPGMSESGRGRLRMVGDGEGRRGMGRVMSYDTIMIRSEGYDSYFG